MAYSLNTEAIDGTVTCKIPKISPQHEKKRRGTLQNFTYR
jgi:hypothetical protein